MRYLNDDNATVRELARDISSDAGVTAELIKLINSSAFGLNSSITHVEPAVKYLGIRRTVSLVFELSFHAIRQSWHDRLPPELMNWFGLRSVVNACVASAFAVAPKGGPARNGLRLGFASGSGNFGALPRISRAVLPPVEAGPLGAAFAIGKTGEGRVLLYSCRRLRGLAATLGISRPR